MVLADGQMLAEGDHINPVVAVRVEGDGLGGDNQKRWLVLPVMDGLSQFQQSLRQIASRFRIQRIGPKQAGQRFAPVGMVAFYGQIGQQGPTFDAAKVGDWPAIQAGSKRTETGNLQLFRSLIAAQRAAG